jgi:hypothetical protein
MPDPIDLELDRCRREGEAVALARIVHGSPPGARLLVWPGGQAMGDLGSPRLNQRVALYVEAFFEHRDSGRKRFELPDGDVEIETTIFRPEGEAGSGE